MTGDRERALGEYLDRAKSDGFSDEERSLMSPAFRAGWDAMVAKVAKQLDEMNIQQNG